MSHIVLPKPRLRHGNKVSGVQTPAPCRVKVQASSSTSICCCPSVGCGGAPNTGPASFGWTRLLTPLSRQQKIWPRTQSPNHVIHHLRGQRSPRVTAPGSEINALDHCSFSWHHYSHITQITNYNDDISSNQRCDLLSPVSQWSVADRLFQSDKFLHLLRSETNVFLIY